MRRWSGRVYGKKLRVSQKGWILASEKKWKRTAFFFSGGEFQKLILARVLFRDAGFVLLDEPTAAMDALAEQETYELYDRLLGNRTMLMISPSACLHKILPGNFVSEGRQDYRTGYS